jgi:hypothetical protein
MEGRLSAKSGRLRLKIKQDTQVMWSKIHQHNYRLIVIFKPKNTANI